MTYNSYNEDNVPADDFEELPEYPTAFGITFTPQIIGICLGVLGVLITGYIIMNFVTPAWTNYQTNVNEKKDRLNQVNQQEFSVLLRKIDDLKAEIIKAEEDQRQLYSLFADNKTVNTLLLDINKFVTERQANIVSYQPEQWEPQTITDSSLGSAVNNKLKRQVVNMTMEGTFVQIQSVLRNIEQLQPLLLLKNFNSEVIETPSLLWDEKQLKTQGEPKLKTSFTMELILPLTAQELEQSQKAEEAAKAAEAEKQKK